MDREHRIRHVVVQYIREIVFGLEDSLVSTLGAITGIAAGAQNHSIVILSGLVIIAVEAVSMSAGSYLSSKSANEAEFALEHDERRVSLGKGGDPVRAGAVMFVFYFLGGLIPLAPYFFLRINDAYFPSIVATGATLYLVGAWSAKYTKRSRMRSGLEMVAVSLSAALIGYLIGHAASLYFPVTGI